MPGVSVESDVSGTQRNIWKAFNGNLTGYCFHSDKGATTGTVTVTFARPVTVARLRLAPQGALFDRLPRDFSVAAEDDQGRWRELARFSGIEVTSFRQSEFNDFPVRAESPYSRYRITITANNGGEYLTFSELSLEERKTAGSDRVKLFLFCCVCLLLLCGARDAQARLEKRFPSPGRPAPVGVFAALALLPFTVCLLQPAQVYIANTAEFRSFFTALLPGLLAAACLLYGFFLGAYFLLPGTGRARPLAVSLALAAGLLAWLQAAVWPWSGGVLNGGELLGREFIGGALQSSAPSMQIYFQAAAWAAGLIFAVLAPRLLRRFSVVLPLAVLGAQLVSVVLQLPSLHRAEGNKSLCPNPDNLFRFSSDHANVVVIVLDMFQSDLFDEIHAGADRRFTGELEGFVYLRNALSGFPVTIASVPNILTGTYFDNSETSAAYVKKVFKSCSLFKSATLAGYKVAAKTWVHNTTYMDREMVPDARPCRSAQWTRLELGLLLDTALFSAAPDVFKPRIYDKGNWFLAGAAGQMFFTEGKAQNSPLGQHKKGDIAFVEMMTSRSRADPGPGTFKFLHLAGNHPPMDMDENLLPADMPIDRPSALRQGKGALVLLGKMLRSMKRLGVYDNSMIFVLGDHGLGLEAGRGRFAGKPLDGWLARGLPLLLVKKPGTGGPLLVSDAPASLGDIPRTVAGRLGWEGSYPGEDLFALAPGLKRKRRFVNANSVRNGKFQEYEISGHSWDPSAWRQVVK